MAPMLIAAIFSAVLGMFQFGFNTGAINSPSEAIKNFINESYEDSVGGLSKGKADTLFSLAVTAFLVGGMIGGLTGGYVADKFGRKRGLLYVQILSVLGALLMGFSKSANSFEMLVIGRFSIGLACGFFTGLAPLYVSEIAPVKIRGEIGTINQLAVTSGLLVSQVLGLNIALGTESGWPALLGLSGIPALLQIILLPFVPESPRYLVINKNEDELGRKALESLRGSVCANDIDTELQEMIKERDESVKASALDDNRVGIRELLTSSSLRLPLCICIAMHLSQQLSGLVAIFYYSTDFFKSSGVTESDAPYATLGVGAIMVTMTLVTIPCMDRLGRRTLHLTGLAGMLFFSILITIALNLRDKEEGPMNEEDSGVGIFLIVSTLSFVVFFALGPGSIPWMITAELFSQGPRPAAIAVATLVNWIANLLVGFTFPVIVSSLEDQAFLPFMVLIALFLAILYIYLPETKGKTVEAISDMMSAPGAWSGKYNRIRRGAT